MSEPVVFDFEEVDEALSRPPIAAQRAFLSTGVMVTSRGWRALSVADRRALAAAGSRGVVDEATVQAVVKNVPIAEVKLCARTTDPDRSEVPPKLNAAIGSVRPITRDEWERLTSLDRYMLNGLSSNPRLLWRSLQELARQPNHPLSDRGRAPWARVESAVASEVARAEVHMAHENVVALMGLEFLDGRAFVLARAAGRRVARAIPAIYDLHADDEIGPIELDWAYEGPGKAVVWQAHVSKGDGSFAAAASLSAAAAAALCLVDMVRERDPNAAVGLLRVVEEPWTVGQAADDEDSSTAIFRGGASANIAKLVEAHRQQAAGKNAGSGQAQVAAALAPRGATPQPAAVHDPAGQGAAHDPVSASIRASGVDFAQVPVGVLGKTTPLAIPGSAGAAFEAPPPSSAGPPSSGANPALDAHKKSLQDPTQLVSRKAAAAFVAQAQARIDGQAAAGYATGTPVPMQPGQLGGGGAPSMQALPPGLVPLPPGAALPPGATGPLSTEAPVRVPIALLVIGAIALLLLLAGTSYLLLR
jgi:molybdenum cofactor biosynthesis enzyme